MNDASDVGLGRREDPSAEDVQHAVDGLVVVDVVSVVGVGSIWWFVGLG